MKFAVILLATVAPISQLQLIQQPSPHTIIKSLGFHPHSVYCLYDTKRGCDSSCRSNQCMYESGNEIGCWGSDMGTTRCHVMHHGNAWKWSETLSSIVRCTFVLYALT